MVTTRSHDKSATSETLALRSREAKPESPMLKRSSIVVEIPAQSNKPVRRSTGAYASNPNEASSILPNSSSETTVLNDDEAAGISERPPNNSGHSPRTDTTNDEGNDAEAERNTAGHLEQKDIQPRSSQAPSNSHKRFGSEDIDDDTIVVSVPEPQTVQDAQVDGHEAEEVDDNAAPEVLSTRSKANSQNSPHALAKPRKKARKSRATSPELSTAAPIPEDANPSTAGQSADTYDHSNSALNTTEAMPIAIDASSKPSDRVDEPLVPRASATTQDIGSVLRAEHIRRFPDHDDHDAEEAYVASLSTPKQSSMSVPLIPPTSRDAHAVSRLPARNSNSLQQFQNQILGRHTRKTGWHGKRANFISAS